MCVHVTVEGELYSTRADAVYLYRTVVGFYYRRYFFGGGGFLHITTMGRGMYKPIDSDRVLLVPTRSTDWQKRSRLLHYHEQHNRYHEQSEACHE